MVYLRMQDGFLLKFLYWPFNLAWIINSDITESISNCIYSTLAYKDEVLGNSVWNSADQWQRLIRTLSEEEV